MYTVARLSIAPIKSTQLHHPDAVDLHTWGAEGNRAFYFARPDGHLFTDKDFGPLVQLRADYDPDRELLTVTFPDGAVLSGDATALGAPVQTDFFGRMVQGRALDGDWSEALSSYAGQPLLLVRPDRPGDGNDSYAVSIVGRASAEELARRSGRSEALDSRRFRMLIEVAGTSPHEEDTWIGRQLQIGQAVVHVDIAVERCVITTLSPSSGVKDFDTLRAIRAYRTTGQPGESIDFGVYARVTQQGTVKVGDPVVPVSDARTA